MGARVFDVLITIERTVRVVVDPAKCGPVSDYQEAAEEFALGGKAAWGDYVLDEDEEYEVECVREITTAQTEGQSQ